MMKDQKEIDANKEKLIKELKQLDASKVFGFNPKKKKSIFKKILIAFGYGKKG